MVPFWPDLSTRNSNQLISVDRILFPHVRNTASRQKLTSSKWGGAASLPGTPLRHIPSQDSSERIMYSHGDSRVK